MARRTEGMRGGGGKQGQGMMASIMEFIRVTAGLNDIGVKW